VLVAASQGCKELWGCAAGEGNCWASAAAGEENWAVRPAAGAPVQQLEKKNHKNSYQETALSDI